MGKRRGAAGERRRAGRPPLAVRRDVTKRLRLTAATAAAQLSAAKREGLTWSAWASAALELALARGSTR